MKKLVEKIYLWSKKKVRENHLKTHKTDIKCTGCNEWYSVSGIEYNHKFASFDYGYSSVCGKCGKKSHWNTIAAPLALLCDEDGTPINATRESE